MFWKIVVNLYKDIIFIIYIIVLRKSFTCIANKNGDNLLLCRTHIYSVISFLNHKHDLTFLLIHSTVLKHSVSHKVSLFFVKHRLSETTADLCFLHEKVSNELINTKRNFFVLDRFNFLHSEFTHFIYFLLLQYCFIIRLVYILRFIFCCCTLHHGFVYSYGVLLFWLS